MVFSSEAYEKVFPRKSPDPTPAPAPAKVPAQGDVLEEAEKGSPKDQAPAPDPIGDPGKDQAPAPDPIGDPGKDGGEDGA